MLEKILEDHALWFRTKGKEGDRAILNGVDLSFAVLKDVCLVEAELMGARLNDADLRGADLRGVNLQDAILAGAQLQGANFEEADLMMSDFKGAQLKGTRLAGAYLHGADLSEAVGLTAEQLKEIYSDENTQLPPGL
jgi:uncharacterized protein YjbI with pentapeptide repeats